MSETITWRQLLTDALTIPGRINEAYRAFHNYSSGNQMLAVVQCYVRNIPVGPIATYPGWKEKGRQVKKGEKAIALWMPVTVRKTETVKDAATGKETEQVQRSTWFKMRPNWFVLAQTDGPEYIPEPVPGWDETTALSALAVTKVPFKELSGNVQGYALPGNRVAVSPIAALPHKTLFHELAHILLGHCEERLTDGEHTPKNLREVEAESVALIVVESLQLPGAAYARGYIQDYHNQLNNNPLYWGQGFPEKSAQAIFKTADRIIRAGNPAKEPHAAIS